MSRLTTVNSNYFEASNLNGTVVNWVHYHMFSTCHRRLTIDHPGKHFRVCYTTEKKVVEQGGSTKVKPDFFLLFKQLIW